MKNECICSKCEIDKSVKIPKYRPDIPEYIPSFQDVSKQMRINVDILKKELRDEIDALKEDLTEHVTREVRKMADWKHYTS